MKTYEVKISNKDTLQDLENCIENCSAKVSVNEKILLCGAMHRFSYEEVNNLLVKHGYCKIGRNKSNVHSIRGTKREKPLLSIIIPVYNEENTVRQVLDALVEKQFARVDKELIIVESNSTDHTREIVKEYEKVPCVKLVLEDRPQGKGHGVRTGLTHATGDFISFQDGDMEYDIDDYDKLLEPLVEYQKAFVLGSRHLKGKSMREFSDQKLVSRVMNVAHVVFTWMVNVVCRSHMKDPFTMYKLFQRECIYKMPLECNRFDFDWEIVIKLIRKGFLPLEIPITYCSRSYSEGKKVSFIKDPLTWMRALVRYGVLKK